MLGQSRHPQGLYYCGAEYQPETIFLMDLIQDLLNRYGRVVQMEFHTGYGPRYQMSMLISELETRDQAQLSRDFDYPRVLRTNPDQFYRMQGDMLDWAYQAQNRLYPHSSYFGTAFEFGSYGEGVLNEIESIKTMILENQHMVYGTSRTDVTEEVQRRFLEMYNSEEQAWREKAVQDAYQGFDGILKYEGMIG
jgi:hypothetical protein